MSRSGGAGSPYGWPDTGLSTSRQSTARSGPLATEVLPGPLHRVRVPCLGAVPGRRVVLALLEGVRRVLLLGDALGQVVRVHVPLRVAELGRALVVAVTQVRGHRAGHSLAYVVHRRAYRGGRGVGLGGEGQGDGGVAEGEGGLGEADHGDGLGGGNGDGQRAGV